MRTFQQTINENRNPDLSNPAIQKNYPDYIKPSQAPINISVMKTSANLQSRQMYCYSIYLQICILQKEHSR